MPTMSTKRPRVLLVSPYSIHPMIHGGAVRLGNLVRRLQRHCELDLFIFLGGSDDPEQRAALAAEGRRVFFQQVPDPGSSAPELPPDAAGFTDPLVAERLRALVSAHGYDLVQLEYAELGAYVHPDLTGTDLGVPVILTEHDLGFRAHERRQEAGIETRHRPREADEASRERRRAFELAACRGAARIHLMSQTDLDLLAEHLPEAVARMRVIPNGVDVLQYTPPEALAPRERLLFVGSFPHLPNLDAARFFLEAVWLQLKGQIPTLRLTLAGARPPEEILALDGVHDVEVAGEVESLLPLYQGHRLLVVPLRAGSGTRLKILEAMACGLPVVSTTIGAEGLGAVHEEHLLIADDPHEMLVAIIRLVTEDDLHQRLARNGRKLVEDRFSWDAIVGLLAQDYLELQGSSPADRLPAGEEGEEDPEISVLVTGEMTDACRAMLEAQELEHSWELVEAETASSLGEALNLAASRARGRILVTLAADAENDDTRWLAKLTAPFFHEAPPAAVAGMVHEIYEGSARRHCRMSTAAHRSLLERFDGLDFSLANAAFRRDVWEAFPFGEADYEAWYWLRRARANGLAVQSILAAWVLRRRAADITALRREARGEGAALRALGARVEPKDLLDDLLHPSRAVEWGSTRDLMSSLVRGDLAARFPWLWAFEVYQGAKDG